VETEKVENEVCGLEAGRLEQAAGAVYEVGDLLSYLEGQKAGP
jgi:hypothetical protein